MPAMARIAANGRVESSALLLTLPDAISGLTANSSAVATQIAEKRGARNRPQDGRGSSGASTTAAPESSPSDGGSTALLGVTLTVCDRRSTAPVGAARRVQTPPPHRKRRPCDVKDCWAQCQ